jgi:hypothetical protein
MTAEFEGISDFEGYLNRIDLYRLKSFIKNLKEPVWENELINVAFGVNDSWSVPALVLYRQHFSLFHVLHRMRLEFEKEKKFLHIHFMRTFLIDIPCGCRYYCADLAAFCGEALQNGSYLCEFHQKLQGEAQLDELSDFHFYMNKENFYSITPENAEDFLNGAWELMVNFKEIEESYRILGLKPGSDLKTTRQRFRHLAHELHPDVANSTEAVDGKEFARVNSAYRAIQKYLMGLVLKNNNA